MVQVITKYNPAAAFGANLGSGIGQSLQKSSENRLDYLRGKERARTSLDELKTSINDPNLSPVEQYMAALYAGQGIPDIARASPQLADMIMRQTQVDQLTGGNKNGPQPQKPAGISMPGQGGMQQMQPGMNELGQQPKQESNTGIPGFNLPNQVEGMAQPQPPTTGGLFGHMASPEEMEANVNSELQILRDPSQRPTLWNNQLTKNKLVQEKRNDFREEGRKLGIKDNEYADFLKIAEKKYSYMTDPVKAADATFKDYVKYKDKLDSLENTFIPGFFTGLFKGPKGRERALKNLVGPTQDIVKLGREDILRPFYSSQGLTQTETESLIHPLSDKIESSLNKLIKGSFNPNLALEGKGESGLSYSIPSTEGLKSYDEVSEKSPKTIQKQNSRLADWLLKNVDEKTSLSVLRDKIVNDNHYDWRQFGPAVREAMSKGLVLYGDQSTELPSLETYAPIQSLADVFTGWGRWYDKLAGKK